MTNLRINEVGLTYGPSREMPTSKITCSTTAYRILKEFWPTDIEIRETFAILIVNKNNQVISFSKICSGGIDSCLADPRIIFATALTSLATGIILAHNHPSGNLQQSKSDIELTKKIQRGASFLDILILDHIILSPDENRYLSFMDEGLM